VICTTWYKQYERWHQTQNVWQANRNNITFFCDKLIDVSIFMQYIHHDGFRIQGDSACCSVNLHCNIYNLVRVHQTRKCLETVIRTFWNPHWINHHVLCMIQFNCMSTCYEKAIEKCNKKFKRIKHVFNKVLDVKVALYLSKNIVWTLSSLFSKSELFSH
jgi:hypothetical protein